MGKGKIKQSSPKVTVVLLCHNSGKKLKETINNQAKTDYPNFEIVIVDNNSEGETKEVLAELEATYTIIHNKKNLGYAGGMNEGIRFGLKLKSKYIGIVTEDMQVHKDWLKDGVEILERNEKNGMAGLNVNPKAIDEFNYMGAGQFGVQAIWEKIIGQKYPKAYFETEQQLVGSILLIKSDLFYKVGLFDDGFFLYCEETDLQERAKKAGYKLFHSMSPAFHSGMGTSIHNPEKIKRAIYWQLRHIIRYSIKHGSIVNIIKTTLIVLYTSFLHKKKENSEIPTLERRLCYYENRLESLVIGIKAVFWNIINLNKTLQARKEMNLMLEGRNLGSVTNFADSPFN